MTQDFFQTFILLVLVTDPFGNVPLFASVLNPVPPARRPRIVIRECAIAFGLLLIFMFFGRHFLAALSNRVLELTPQGVHQYGGGYAEYVARTGQEAPGLHPGG